MGWSPQPGLPPCTCLSCGGHRAAPAPHQCRQRGTQLSSQVVGWQEEAGGGGKGGSRDTLNTQPGPPALDVCLVLVCNLPSTAMEKSWNFRFSPKMSLRDQTSCGLRACGRAQRLCNEQPAAVRAGPGHLHWARRPLLSTS